MTRANCPSCGALVTFTTKATIATICGPCRSVVRQAGAELIIEAQVTAVVEDATPFCVGTTGSYGRRAFRLMGRLQVRHGAGGFWNEWAMAFDDGAWGWLSEAAGVLTVYEPEPASKRSRITASLGEHQPGGVVQLQGIHFRVKEVGTAHVSGGEGELPCPAGQGWALPFVDLGTHGHEAATIDYSDNPPAVYVGAVVDYDDLAFQGTREQLPPDHPMARVANATVETVSCPSCGGGLERRTGAQAQSLHCSYCGAGIDLRTAPFSALGHSDWSGSLPGGTFKIGQFGRVEGVDWVILGTLERHIPRWNVSWLEYLLHNDKRGYRWLVESDGHFTWIESLASVPLDKGSQVLLPAGRGRELDPAAGVLGEARRPASDVALTLRESNRVVVARVAGEFYWQVKAGDAADVREFAMAPWTMSAEDMGSERTWSVGRYCDPKALSDAFGGLAMPSRVGTVPHQPPPQDKWLKPLWWRWLLAAGLLVAGVVVTAAMSKAEIVVSDQFTVSLPAEPELRAALARDPGEPVLDAYLDSLVRWYPSFQVPKGPEALEVTIGTNLQNGWMIAHGSLFDEERGEAVDFQDDISYYSGSDWSEGSTGTSVILPSVKSGTYTFRFEPIPGELPTGEVQVSLTVTRDVALHRWFWLALALLSLPVVVLFFARVAFIARRDKVEDDD